SLPHDVSDDASDAFVGGTTITVIVLLSITGALSGERDTPTGRTAAARWLGLRVLLAEDPVFSEQPPGAIAIWDRYLAHGAALGVAHGAVTALPLGAERERQAWSPIGGRWRLVRIRYPRRLPPGYGRHPLQVALIGLVVSAIAAFLLPLSASAAG